MGLKLLQQVTPKPYHTYDSHFSFFPILSHFISQDLLHSNQVLRVCFWDFNRGEGQWKLEGADKE